MRMARSLGRRIGALTLAAVVTLAMPAGVHACSICRCGDPTFNALGKDGFGARGFRAALDGERFDKTEGDPARDAESQVEDRFTALLSYGINERFTLFARVPHSTRTLVAASDHADGHELHTSGFSDPEIYGRMRLWSSSFSGGLGRRSSLSLDAGVKTAWGQNNVKEGGERLDEHAQPGTGSTDLFANLAFLYLINEESAFFFSSGYRKTGENAFGYHYGNAVLANVAYEHKLGKIFDGVMEMNFRRAARDRTDSLGAKDGDTGGALVYATPRLLVSLGKGVVLRIAAQIPVLRGLNGFQKERAVANIGLTYLFSR